MPSTSRAPQRRIAWLRYEIAEAMPRSLNEADGLRPSYLMKNGAPTAAARSAFAGITGVCPSPSQTTSSGGTNGRISSWKRKIPLSDCGSRASARYAKSRCQKAPPFAASVSNARSRSESSPPQAGQV